MWKSWGSGPPKSIGVNKFVHFYNTRSTHTIPGSTKMHGLTQKYPVRHKNALPSIYQLILPLWNLFSDFLFVLNNPYINQNDHCRNCAAVDSAGQGSTIAPSKNFVIPVNNNKASLSLAAHGVWDSTTCRILRKCWGLDFILIAAFNEEPYFIVEKLVSHSHVSIL